MARESVIVIGAGLSGLSTGSFLQMNGYRTRIFEHHDVPGGVAACWKRGRYFIDGGIHFVMGYRPGTKLYDLYRQLGVGDAGMYVPNSNFGRFIDEESGVMLDVTSDLDRLPRQFRDISPVDTPFIEFIIAGAKAMQGRDLGSMGMEKPPELMGTLDDVREIWQMRSLLKYFTGKYGQTVADYTEPMRNPVAKDIVRSMFLPEVPVGFLSMMLAIVADGQAGLIKNGCFDFVLAMERRFKELGGRVAYRSTVERILVHRDRAVGVRLTDGTEHRADAVVAACDGRSTLFGMLDGRYLTPDIKKQYDSWPLFRPMIMASYGVNRLFLDLPPFVTLRLSNPPRVANEDVRQMMVRIMNYGPKFAPEGKTVVQVEIETDWDYWNELQARDRSACDAEKQRLAAEIAPRMDTFFPGFSGQIEMVDVATPYTTWRYTRNYRGAWEGWMITADALNTRMKRKLPGLDNFYMAGQWVVRGGGVPACLFSGRHVAQIMAKEDGRAFTTHLP